ncbi:hypothetical protein J6590_097756 [Homalodisca vitripennis]|nr:hypothetical protein J6590_097756 [Homalodisca vitripennis]
MASCGICMNPLEQKKTLTCCKCGKRFHCTCLDINKAKMECITADTWTYINCTEQKRKRRRVDVDGEKSFPWQTSLRKYSKLKKNQKSQEESFNKKIELLNEKLDTNRRLLNGILEITGGLLKLNDKLGKREDVLSVVKEVRKALGMDVVDSMFDAYHRMGDRAAHNSIYVNEDLTPARRRLLGMGRQLKSDNDDRHLGVEGKIFLAKDDDSAIGYKTVLVVNGLDSLVNGPARITSLPEIMYVAVAYVSITDHSVIRLVVMVGEGELYRLLALPILRHRFVYS